MAAELGELITVTPGVRSGKACVTGTRITVSDVLGYLASGMSQEEILLDFPDLKAEHIRAVLRYASERGRPAQEQPSSTRDSVAVRSHTGPISAATLVNWTDARPDSELDPLIGPG